MSFNHTYAEMLDAAHKKLPELVTFTERFEIPLVSSSVQGNKTIFKSYKQIAKTLRREDEQFIKFMIRELATTGEAKGSDFIFIGKFLKSFLQDKVNKYAKDFVLCDKCGKPDTHLIKEGEITYKQCEACGNKIIVKTLK